ncbi:MAG: hypothetical protein H7641_03340 [Candidatus Heimdallarchaeota archaeon]|nr:hypothetical protein [Candidatus Heimdallarchaeota archaeon]MCK4876596.1 hypothetical protein [Candidatus Heimdallarchaeota archaeon]
MNDHEILKMKIFQDYPPFYELNSLRFKIQRELTKQNETFEEGSPTAYVDAEESSELYDLHTQITSIIGLLYLDELFLTIDAYSCTHHADFIEGLQGVINSTEDYDDLFFVQLDDYEWDYEWNDQLQIVRKKVNDIPLKNRIELLKKLRKQILRKMDKAIELWVKPKERLSKILSAPEIIINFLNHYLFLQSFENYDSSMIFTKQLRTYIKSRPYFPAITSDILFSEIIKLGEIAEKHGFNNVIAFLNKVLYRFDELS